MHNPLIGQQLPLLSQYTSQISALNPAAPSVDFLLFEQTGSVGASSRVQWAGLDGNPRTYRVHGQYIIDNGTSQLLVGGQVIHDETDPIQNTSFYGQVGVLLSEDPTYSGISIGLNAGMSQYRVMASQLQVRDENDVVLMGDYNQLYPDVGVGVFAYQTLEWGILDGDMVYAGISAPQILGLNVSLRNDAGEFDTERSRHFYGQAGLYKRVGESLMFEPSTWVKYVPNAPLNANFNLRMLYNNQFWLGTGLSTSDILQAEAGVIVGSDGSNMLHLGYTYSYPFNSFGNVLGQTHEFNVRFAFGHSAY